MLCGRVPGKTITDLAKHVAAGAAAAIVVLLTPDDEARLVERLRTPGEDSDCLEGQPRANVLFEAGMAFGRKQKSTVLVQMGRIRHISDLAGRHIVRLNNSMARRQELATKLRSAGCDVNTDGTDWHTVGNLEITPPTAR